MNAPTNWIKHHQIIAFFVITFAIAWGLGFSYDAVMNKGTFLLAPLVFVATCGPALAGIIVSTVCNNQPREGTKRTYWIAFLVAWIVSTLVFLANNTYINHAPFSPVMVVFTIVSVVPVAFVISMAYSRIPAVKSYLSSLTRLRGVWGWSILALILSPALVLFSILVSSLLGRQPIAAHHFQATALALVGLVAVKFLYQFFFFNATGEEAGWRGFALPRMQSLTSPLVACLVINFFWPLWHLFFWMAEGRSVFSLEYWVKTYLELLPATVVIGWFYNRSKGSILVAGTAHAAFNTVFAFFPNLNWTVYNSTVAVAALVMIVADRMWKKLPSDHPAVYQAPVLAAQDQNLHESEKEK
jgi:membrane protease YdiL (CAAX protease family)